MAENLSIEHYLKNICNFDEVCRLPNVGEKIGMIQEDKLSTVDKICHKFFYEYDKMIQTSTSSCVLIVKNSMALSEKQNVLLLFAKADLLIMQTMRRRLILTKNARHLVKHMQEEY